MAGKAGTYYAHSIAGKPPEAWQPLDVHLRNVAEFAGEFAKPFGGEEWAYLAGLWHDLGKYNPDFKRRLEGENIRVVHSEAGGHLATLKKWTGTDTVLSWLIMGHHAGLADYSSDKTGAKALEPKMRNPEGSNAILKHVPSCILDQAVPTMPRMFSNHEKYPDQAFFIRMLYSCLVDADYLDTEAFMNPRKGEARVNALPDLRTLLEAFDRYMLRFADAKGPVNECRADILAQCCDAASRRGVFSLTVPTGGGKTLASLAFALRHAVMHEKRRIIYVIPYTSIIEQTAEVFRDIPGFEEAVLEHHCNMVDTDEEGEEYSRSRLATENWDAPIVVTTSVQFFESLFANRSSRCRKLHNIADSVVIFDEAQCLPPAFLRPCVFAIRELNRHYGVTPVLCTATQPVLDKKDSFDFKFKERFECVHEIISHPDELSRKLERVRVKRLRDLAPISYPDLAEQIVSEGESVLCILNRKADARELAELLPEKQTVHLSTNMCAEHRFQVLETIFKRLENDAAPLYVISTSLVEAGVDLDFPVVYRSLAGLDSIAQAAGRCNREGKLKFGRMVVFMPEQQPLYVKPAASLAIDYLREERIPNIFLPETFRNYFNEYFFMKGSDALDKEGIRGLLPKKTEEICFQTAAEKFRLIDNDWQVALIVPFGEAAALVDQLLEEPWNAKRICRKLQRYTVNVSRNAFNALLDGDYARMVGEFEGLHYLHVKQLYDERFGFTSPVAIDCFNWEDLIE